MEHKEFKLIVTKAITENSGRNVYPIIYKVGDTLTLNEKQFDDLQSGSTITFYTNEGIMEFDKYNFENEVSYTSVTIEYGVRKLGQLKNKNK
jgi:hypothetical protein